MNRIVFVTSNDKKVKSAQKYFDGIELVFHRYDLIEPRSESLEEIAKHKVLQSYEIVRENCIALDSGFYIEALNGWPGSYVNFNLQKLGLEGILKLLENIENRNACFKECLAYFDGTEIKYFYGLARGSIASSITEIDSIKQWSNLGKIFIIENQLKTLADMTPEESDYVTGTQTSSLREFSNWYKCKKR